MTKLASYMYLSSDTQLPSSESADLKINNNPAIFHFSPDSNRYFFFESFIDSKNQSTLSHSKHFSEAKYQVVSVNHYLPKEYRKQLNQQNKKALHELFSYLVSHFEKTKATYVEILFCSAGNENATLLKEKLVSYEWLSIDDLHSSERKFMRIDTQMTEFIFRKRTA